MRNRAKFHRISLHPQLRTTSRLEAEVARPEIWLPTAVWPCSTSGYGEGVPGTLSSQRKSRKCWDVWCPDSGLSTQIRHNAALRPTEQANTSHRTWRPTQLNNRRTRVLHLTTSNFQTGDVDKATSDMADLERIRLVLLGGAGVGKSSIVKRFLFKTYTDKYRATVEDLYNREYDLGGVTLKVSTRPIPLFRLQWNKCGPAFCPFLVTFWVEFYCNWFLRAEMSEMHSQLYVSVLVLKATHSHPAKSYFWEKLTARRRFLFKNAAELLDF